MILSLAFPSQGYSVNREGREGLYSVETLHTVFSQVMEVNISNVSHVHSVYPGYNMMKLTVYLFALPPNNPKP